MLDYGVGLIALPWDLIVDYFYRPKQIDEFEFEKRKKILLDYALELRDLGKKMQEDNNYTNNIMGLEGLRVRSRFESKLRSYECRSIMLETEFTKLQ